MLGKFFTQKFFAQLWCYFQLPSRGIMMGVLLVDGCTTSGIVSVCTKKSTPVRGGKDSLSSLNYLDKITSLFFSHRVLTRCTFALLNLQLTLFDLGVGVWILDLFFLGVLECDGKAMNRTEKSN